MDAEEENEQNVFNKINQINPLKIKQTFTLLITDSSLVIRTSMIELYNITTEQHGGDFPPCSLSWEDAVSSPVL